MAPGTSSVNRGIELYTGSHMSGARLGELMSHEERIEARAHILIDTAMMGVDAVMALIPGGQVGLVGRMAGAAAQQAARGGKLAARAVMAGQMGRAWRTVMATRSAMVKQVMAVGREWVAEQGLRLGSYVKKLGLESTASDLVHKWAKGRAIHDRLERLARWMDLDACFCAGTPLLTPDGWCRNIEEFVAGDLILTRSEFDPDGPPILGVVEDVFRRVGKVLHLHVGGEVIRTSAEHPFYSAERGWVAAAELGEGDLLLSHNGHWVAVEEVYDTGEYEVLYNLRVGEHHTYFVGSPEWGFSVWAHNAYNEMRALLPDTLPDSAYRIAYGHARNGNWSRFRDYLQSWSQRGEGHAVGTPAQRRLAYDAARENRSFVDDMATAEAARYEQYWLAHQAQESNLLGMAREARDAFAQELGVLPGPRRPAAVTAGYHVETGQIVARASHGGYCAENRVVQWLGGDATKVRFTEAVRPRAHLPPYNQVPVCARCEATFGREPFTSDTLFQNDL